MLRLALVLGALLLGLAPAEAASRFWVGGAGTWDNASTTHWAATTGGANGASVPTTTDTVTLDGSSGGGTVTVNTTVNVTSITFGAFTGTLDFSANNNSVTAASISGTGSGTRTLNMGSGIWTLTGTATVWNFLTGTNLTFNNNGASIIVTATTVNTRAFNSASGLTYGNLSISANSSGGAFTFSGAVTFGTLAVTGPNCIVFQNGATLTLTGMTFNGTSGSEVLAISSSIGTAATVSVASGTPAPAWSAFRDMTFTGGATFTATNSFNLGNNTGITITAPQTGGGGVFGG